MERNRQRWLLLSLIAVVLLAGFLRTSGLFRGLDEDVIFHPDAPKQMLALRNYLAGKYIWYFDSPYYDGYPYGLNRVDEALARTARAIVEPLRRWLDPQEPGHAALEARESYVWGRSLRVLYGLVTVLLGFLVARRLLGSEGAALAAALLLAISPLAAAVTHEATGDVGVDLFTAAAAAAMCIYALKRRSSALIFCGVLCGLGFSAKYQGGLILFIPVVYLLLEFALASRKIARLAGGLAAVAGGFALGAVAATPAFVENPTKAWRNMVTNFHFIRDYGVDASFLEKPWTEKVRVGLTQGLPFVVAHIGWGVVLLALAGFVLLTLRLLRSRGRIPPGSPDMSRLLLAWTLAAFPFFVLVLSTALKAAVQPFHFSYIVMPLCVGAAAVVLEGRASRGRGGTGVPPSTAAAVVLLVLAAGELGLRSARETFFWAREDTRQAATAFANEAFTNALPVRGDLPPSRWVIKYFCLERNNPAVFRNPCLQLLHDFAPFWRELHVAPVPSVPFPRDGDYIFLDGPVLPRNDRMFAVEPGRSARRVLVAYGRAPELKLGIRTGPVPSELRVRVGGARVVRTLGENSQDAVSVERVRWSRVRGSGPEGEDVFLARVEASARLGRAWLTILSDPRELDHFRRFGGELAEPPALANAAEIAERVRETRFVEAVSRPLLLGASPQGSWILPAHTPLPAGCYLLECRVDAGDEPCEVSFEMADPRGLPDERLEGDVPRARGFAERWPTREVMAASAGASTLRYRFAKTFFPYEVNIRATCLRGRCRVLDWRLVPDTEAMLAGGDAAWCRAAPEPDEAEETRPQGILFGRWLGLSGYALPDRLTAGEPFEYLFRLDVRDFGLPDFYEWVLFAHLVPAGGGGRTVLDVPLSLACYGDAPGIPMKALLPADLAPGDYTLSVGVYNLRTRKRMPVTAEGAEVRDRAVVLKKVVVEQRTRKPGVSRRGTSG